MRRQSGDLEKRGLLDPEQIYHEVLQDEQRKGSSPAVAEGRAKAARARAQHGSPHPKEPKWWPGAQPHLEGAGAPAAPAAEEAPAPAEEAPAPEPAVPEAAPAAQPAAAAQAAAEAAPEPATAPAAQAVPTRADELAVAEATGQPEAATIPPAPDRAPAAAAAAASPTQAPPEVRPAGVTHGTTTGTRLRPEDEVSTDAQFEGQRAMYERRKLIDELVSTGVPEVTAAETGARRAPALAILYILIPLLAIGYLASRPAGEAAGGEAGGEQHEQAGGGAAVTLVAQGVAFDQDQITLPANQQVTVTLENRDSMAHNFALYPNAEAGAALQNAIFDGADIPGGESIDYEFESPGAGEYFFQCDLHPTAMTGTATVE